MKRALICGIGGQDGSYLAELLLRKGYRVWGTTRSLRGFDDSNLKKMGIIDDLTIIEMVSTNETSVAAVIADVRPDEVYNLSGQSSVGLSFQYPTETFNSAALSVVILLEELKKRSDGTKFFNAGSGECFGHTQEGGANEATPFSPQSPYAVAKAAAFWAVATYRSNYGLFACTGLLFNHESPLRHERFVTMKTVRAAYRIANGSSEVLELGDLSIRRDWGWAPEYVYAMWQMLQCDSPQDFVLATGTTQSLETFVESVFTQAALDWRKHVKSSKGLYRPSEPSESKGDATKALSILGWKAKTAGADVAKNLFSEYAVMCEKNPL